MGVILDSFRTWSWHIGTLGIKYWMVSEHNLPGQTNVDPLWIQRSLMSSYIEDIEVVLVGGGWPDLHNVL